MYRGLAHLQAAEFLYETRLFPEREFTFKHALTHEVAYSGLLQERRRALHAQIVATIEQLYADRLADHVERLAHHALRGELWDKALTYFRQAGAKAMARSALRETVVCLEQALHALQRLPESRETMVQGVDLRLELRNALLPLGEYDRIFDTLREAETLVTALDDARRLGRVHVHLTHYFWITRNLERALVAGQRALTLATPLDDFELYAMANFNLAEVYYSLGDYLQAYCHQGLGTLYATTGQRQQAHAELSAAIVLYRAMDMTFWLPQAEAALAQVGGAEPSARGV
jgi:tetratricopeptide (TPR) repeat protein